MNIQISNHGLRFNEDLEYIATYIKGKNKKASNYRILVKGTKTGKEYLLLLEPRENFFGRTKSQSIGYINDFQHINNDQIKNRQYNYYKLGYDLNTVDEFFTEWVTNDPMVITGNFQHSFISQIKNYTWSYKFNNKTY